MCDCNKEKFEVCDECNRVAVETITELSEYAKDFVDKRFPSGLNGDIRVIVTEIIIDAFYDGARWQEQQTSKESVIIQP